MSLGQVPGNPGHAGDDLTVTPRPPHVEITVRRHLARLLTVLAVLAAAFATPGTASGVTTRPRTSPSP